MGCTTTATAPVAATPSAPVVQVPPPGPNQATTGLPPLLARLAAAPAATAPLAHVRVRAALPAGQSAVLLQFSDADQCKGPQRLSRAATGTDAPISQGLPAGRLVTLDFAIADPSRLICVVRWSFTPQADRQYLVQGTSLTQGCAATLTDVTQADRPRTPQDLRLRTGPGNACVPMATARRVPPGLLEGGQVNGEAVLRPLATDEDLKGLIPP